MGASWSSGQTTVAATCRSPWRATPTSASSIPPSASAARRRSSFDKATNDVAYSVVLDRDERIHISGRSTDATGDALLRGQGRGGRHGGPELRRRRRALRSRPRGRRERGGTPRDRLRPPHRGRGLHHRERFVRRHDGGAPAVRRHPRHVVQRRGLRDARLRQRSAGLRARLRRHRRALSSPAPRSLRQQRLHVDAVRVRRHAGSVLHRRTSPATAPTRRAASSGSPTDGRARAASPTTAPNFDYAWCASCRTARSIRPSAPTGARSRLRARVRVPA